MYENVKQSPHVSYHTHLTTCHIVLSPPCNTKCGKTILFILGKSDFKLSLKYLASRLLKRFCGLLFLP